MTSFAVAGRATAMRGADQSKAGGKIGHDFQSFAFGQSGPKADFIHAARTAKAKPAGLIHAADIDAGA